MEGRRILNISQKLQKDKKLLDAYIFTFNTIIDKYNLVKDLGVSLFKRVSSSPPGFLSQS